MNERILNLLSLCMQAKEKGHDVFFGYRPHIDGVEISSCEGGWFPAEFDGNGNITKTATSKEFSFSIIDENTYKNIDEAEAYLKGLI